jgi:hypothetical protein
MQKGEVYIKHVRGSRYGFSNNKLFYKYPGGGKNYVIGNWDSLIDDLIGVRGEYGGRIVINENKEVVMYKKTDIFEWIPFYIGKIDCEMRFEGIENNPRDLRPGLLWTGFASHHGSQFSYKINGRVFFRETTLEDGVTVTRQYPVLDIDDELIERLKYFKIQPGRFYVNEYRHVWAPVPLNVIKQCYNDPEIIHIDDIHKQFSNLTSEQKNTIRKYSQDFRYNRTGEMWYPVYIGKYGNPINIKRPDGPHRITSEEDM